MTASASVEEWADARTAVRGAAFTRERVSFQTYTKSPVVQDMDLSQIREGTAAGSDP